MARWQGLSRRTKSGARLKKHHEKRKAELGRFEAQTIIGQTRVKKIRTRGDNLKLRALRLEFCNLTDPNTGKSEKVKIIDVESNQANKEYTRRKVMTRGALIRTEKGYAIITNRPGQEGFISAVPTQFDVAKTQERTISAKKKKRQTIQRKKVGSTAGTQKKKTTTKPAPAKAPAKPTPTPAAKPTPTKKEPTTETKKTISTTAKKPAASTTTKKTTSTTKKSTITTTKKETEKKE
ncbi:MAG TPA: 30S ribosomal protein S8e [candidate division Zixibacteria bacterium]|nr:30S ribosomal protein S8e [candidate division Zixibacteria bacterium]